MENAGHGPMAVVIRFFHYRNKVEPQSYFFLQTEAPLTWQSLIGHERFSWGRCRLRRRSKSVFDSSNIAKEDNCSQSFSQGQRIDIRNCQLWEFHRQYLFCIVLVQSTTHTVSVSLALASCSSIEPGPCIIAPTDFDRTGCRVPPSFSRSLSLESGWRGSVTGPASD